MGKALRGEAVVYLPRASNNTDHGRLLLARRVNSFQSVSPIIEGDKLYVDTTAQQNQ
ncbi:hypothetical protein D3OALGA1CA_3498 [Olavius algarvensis associated proteobacterium Delta 3]|nr:hypothetical protein D3OALGB2SA_3804 [Olavius algarvensis associated proteobacterium Delta 3]CAB5135334.1 hypothetical protein D3OALGA1CA_3498 [Olavius algarvensis associated proteobacterium Delta 3]